MHHKWLKLWQSTPYSPYKTQKQYKGIQRMCENGWFLLSGSHLFSICHRVLCHLYCASWEACQAFPSGPLFILTRFCLVPGRYQSSVVRILIDGFKKDDYQWIIWLWWTVPVTIGRCQLWNRVTTADPDSNPGQTWIWPRLVNYGTC